MRGLAVADLDHDDANLRLDAPAVGEDDHLLPWKARYSEPIGKRGRDQRERRTGVDEDGQVLLVDCAQLNALIDVPHGGHVARTAPDVTGAPE